MKYEEALEEEVGKHSEKMKEVFDNLRLLMREKGFKEYYELAEAYYDDSQHFRRENEWIKAFEALMISWAYVDAGLKLDIFELKKEELADYFTIKSYHE